MPSLPRNDQPTASQAPAARPAVSERRGPRALEREDARHRIERLAASLALEDESSTGPASFRPRIRAEPFPKRFSLPRDTTNYNGSAKPEDWLIDYMTAVGIAGGNRRVAVRYAPSCSKVQPGLG